MRMRNAKEKREVATKKMFDSLELVMVDDADAELLLDGASAAKKKREGKERNSNSVPPGRKKRENSGDMNSSGGNLYHSPLSLTDGKKEKEDNKRSNHERARSNTKTT